jgi:hypothetical protein
LALEKIMKKKHLNWLLLGAAAAGAYYLFKGSATKKPTTTTSGTTSTTTSSTGDKANAPSSPTVQAGILGNGKLGSLGGSIF